MKNPSATLKQYVVLVLTGDCTSSALAAESSNQDEKEPGEFQQGYFVIPKGKRGMDDEYFSSASTRKGSGIINIKLPYKGDASGMGFEVRAIENKEIISICTRKIKIDQVRLLEEPSKTAYSKTVQQLIKEQPDGNKYPPALDAIKGTYFLPWLNYHMNFCYFIEFSIRLEKSSLLWWLLCSIIYYYV